MDSQQKGIFKGMKHFLDDSTYIKKFTRDRIYQESPFDVKAAIDEVEEFLDECI